MTERPVVWARIFLHAFLGRTRCLSEGTLGAYVRVAFQALSEHRRPPDDDRQLARWAGVSLATWRQAREELDELGIWRVSGNELRDEFIDDRLAHYDSATAQKRQAGIASGKARRLRVVEGGRGGATDAPEAPPPRGAGR